MANDYLELREACEVVIRSNAARAQVDIPGELLDQAIPAWVDKMIALGVYRDGDRLRLPAAA